MPIKVCSRAPGVEASTICKFIPEVCKAIIAVYKDKVLHCPKTEEDWKEVAPRFSSSWNYHNCLGAVDGKHIAIKNSRNAGSYYYNYKGFHSIVLMAVADATYKFLYVDIGAEGGASDGGTWSNCSLHDAVEDNRAGLPQPELLPNDDHPVPYHFTTMQQNPDTINLITMCACVLHNIILLRYSHAISEVDYEDPDTHDLIPGGWRTEQHLQGL
ncbi:putative nuclease HARBI1 [Palaemon carinicauda]|uniref:putative nuclease HARBI1 n=1 Tax=Palaemon carinicauda TaxID=392227 RepID=UPI0035B6019F